MFLEIVVTDEQRKCRLVPLRVVDEIPDGLDTPEGVVVHDFGGKPHVFSIEDMWNRVGCGVGAAAELRKAIGESAFFDADMRLVPHQDDGIFKKYPSIHAFIPLAGMNAVALWRPIMYINGAEERPDQAVWSWTSLSPHDFSESCYREADRWVEENNLNFDPSKRAVLPRRRETALVIHRHIITVDRWKLLPWGDPNERVWNAQEHWWRSGMFSLPWKDDVCVVAERHFLRWEYRKLEDWRGNLPICTG